MLNQGTVDRVLALLAQRPRLSRRKIAELAGCCCTSVSRIRLGLTSRQQPDILLPDDEAAIDEGPKVRCIGCGGMVCLPCRTCRDRESLASKGNPPSQFDAGDDALKLDLEPEHQANYSEAVEMRKRRESLNQTDGEWQEPTNGK